MNSRHTRPQETFLTPNEVVTRYRDEITLGTLKNWRCAGRGPPFVKIGRAVLYPLSGLEAWETRGPAKRLVGPI